MAAYVILWLPILTFSLIAKYDNPGDRISTRRPVARSVWETLKPYPDAYFFTTDTTLANFLPSRAVVPQHFLAAIAYDTGMVNYDRLQELINSGRVRLCVVGSGQDPSRQLGFLGVKADCYVRVRTEGLYSLWEFSPTSPGKKAATSAPQANEHIAAASSAR